MLTLWSPKAWEEQQDFSLWGETQTSDLTHSGERGSMMSNWIRNADLYGSSIKGGHLRERKNSCQSFLQNHQQFAYSRHRKWKKQSMKLWCVIMPSVCLEDKHRESTAWDQHRGVVCFPWLYCVVWTWRGGSRGGTLNSELSRKTTAQGIRRPMSPFHMAVTAAISTSGVHPCTGSENNTPAPDYGGSEGIFQILKHCRRLCEVLWLECCKMEDLRRKRSQNSEIYPKSIVLL